MPEGKAIVTYLVSAAAMLGPLAYILFAFHEFGRLTYFGAPIDFLQISSFGIIPVVTTIYPGMLITFMVLALCSGVRFSSPSQQVALVACAITYAAGVFFYLSTSPLWMWLFGSTSFIGFLVVVFMKRHTPDLGNDAISFKGDPQHPSIKHYETIRRYLFVFIGAAIFCFIYATAGEKDAATRDFYWVMGNDVVIGFYGDQALLGELRGSEVGPKFRLVGLKVLEGTMTKLQVGPLTASPLWKARGYKK